MEVGICNSLFLLATCIVFFCTAVDHPTSLAAERLQEDSGSFRVLWTPPAFTANLTGYRIYYSGANDSGSVDVDASATNITIDNRITGVTYSITIVALTPHLPSSVVGPTTVTPGEVGIQQALIRTDTKTNLSIESNVESSRVQ